MRSDETHRQTLQSEAIREDARSFLVSTTTDTLVKIHEPGLRAEPGSEHGFEFP
jgi:hypothetical protein